MSKLRNRFRNAFWPVVAGFIGSWAGQMPAQPWTLTSAPQTNWVSLASSADGSLIAAVAFNGPMCISTNGGDSWTTVLLQANPWITNWTAVTVSADGTRLAATTSDLPNLGAQPGLIYLSTNSGANWFPSGAPTARWSALAGSADGLKLFAVAKDAGRIYTSSDGGGTWSQTAAASNEWNSVACSADATVLLACTAGEYSPGVVCGSTNSGATWQTNLNGIHYAAVACAADAATVAVAEAPTYFRGFPYTWPLDLSFNSRATWSRANLDDYWKCVTVSAGGNRIIAGARSFPEWSPGGELFTSSDGQTWETNAFANQTWNAVTCSADGAKATAASSGIYVRSFPIVQPQLSLSLTNGQAVLSWIIPSTLFTLQQSIGLTSAWTDVPELPVVRGVRYEVALPQSGGGTFYRLLHVP